MPHPLSRAPGRLSHARRPMPEVPLRDDHTELLRRRALTEDAAPAGRRSAWHDAGGRTARENILDLVDDGSFVEYGRFAIAAQRARRRRSTT